MEVIKILKKKPITFARVVRRDDVKEYETELKQREYMSKVCLFYSQQDFMIIKHG